MISVILTTQDSPRFLAEQLHALVVQDFGGEWEVVVAPQVDVGAVRALATTFSDRLPGLRVCASAAGETTSHARNRAAEEAKGDRLVFWDGNDVAAPHALSAHAKALESHELTGGPILLHDINAPWTWPGRPWLDPLERALAVDRFLPWTSEANLSVRRTLHERLSGFDPHVGLQAGPDFCWRASMAGARLVFSPLARVHHRLHTRPGDIRRHARRFAWSFAALERKFAAFGMKTNTPAEPAWFHGWLLLRLIMRDLRHARGDRTRMTAWSATFGLRLGALQGALRHSRTRRTCCPPQPLP